MQPGGHGPQATNIRWDTVESSLVWFRGKVGRSGEGLSLWTGLGVAILCTC